MPSRTFRDGRADRTRVMSAVSAVLGWACALMAIVSSALMLGPVFRSANCYGRFSDANGWLWLGLAAAVVCGALAAAHARIARTPWPLLVGLGILAAVSVPLIAFLGHPGIPEEGALLEACGRGKPLVYAMLLFLDLPLVFAGAAILLGRVVRRNSMFIALVVAVAVAGGLAYVYAFIAV